MRSIQGSGKPQLKEQILDFISDLNREKIHILVEGTKDRDALIYLGIRKNRVFTLGKPLFEVAELIASKTKKCIILTDLDKEGEKLFSQLKKEFSRLGIKTDEKFREFLFKNTKLRQIEGLIHYLDNMED